LSSFRSLVVLKRPVQELWTNMRDRLPELAAGIVDVESVQQLERRDDGDGIVRITNRWRSSQTIPPLVRPILRTDQASWVDRNAWDIRTLTCAWSIEPDFLAEYLSCTGETTFAETMAGRGTRVTFAGTLELKPGLMEALGSLAAIGPGFIESIVTSAIPRNLRAVAEAAAAFGADPEGAG
jgi:hypothetical protein